ncbi:hypothetical protein ACFOMD_01400 [Sphingoaurantiacus capsulatus]|uniref:Uncharacterized protein n=1 Tax=Sphingoaurantiacus capsulatus TaxID=1771310 RepID=A0ABV7X5F2_9SPHN
MTTIIGHEIYACPVCGGHVELQIYGSANSWTYPATQPLHLSDPQSIRCADGHAFRPESARLLCRQRYGDVKAYGLLATLFRWLRRQLR